MNAVMERFVQRELILEKSLTTLPQNVFNMQFVYIRSEFELIKQALTLYHSTHWKLSDFLISKQ